jgi:hypothetical protein
MTLPNTIIIGASKCGTTALHSYFERHKDIYTTTKKELHFHAYDALKRKIGGEGDKYLIKYICTSFSEYQDYYKDFNEEKSITDVSPSYLFFPDESIASIKKHCGENVKIIILVRNPVDKMISQYSHLYSAGREALSFQDALEKEIERKKNSFSDMWLYRESGYMSDKVLQFKKNFKDVLVLHSKDLNQNPKSTLEEIFEFIGVDSIGFDYSSLKTNVSGIPKNRLVAKVFIKPNIFTYALRKVIPQQLGRAIRDFINRNNKGAKLKVSQELRNQLDREYKVEVGRLNSLIVSKTKI